MPLTNDVPLYAASDSERWVGGDCWRGLLSHSSCGALRYPWLLIYRVGDAKLSLLGDFSTKLFETEEEAEQFMDGLDTDGLFKEGDK